MKKLLFLLLSIVVLSAFSPNVSSFTITLGKTKIAQKPTNHLGETFSIPRSIIQPGDSLFVSMYFCGSNASGNAITLKLENTEGKEIRTYFKKETEGFSMFFQAGMPAKDLLEIKELKNGQEIKVYLTVHDKNDAKGYGTSHIGKFKLVP